MNTAAILLAFSTVNAAIAGANVSSLVSEPANDTEVAAEDRCGGLVGISCEAWGVTNRVAAIGERRRVNLETDPCAWLLG